MYAHDVDKQNNEREKLGAEYMVLTMEMYNIDTLLNNLKALRKKRNMSQEKLAEKLNISPKTYGKYERGRLNISIVTLVELSNILEVPVEQLLFGATPSHDDDLLPKLIALQEQLTSIISTASSR